MIFKTVIYNETFTFNSLYEIMAKANEEKSGDILAGIAAISTKERVAAKMVLADIQLKSFKEQPAISYESDEVTRIIIDDLDLEVYETIKEWTVRELREWLLRTETTNDEIAWIRGGLTSEMIAAVTKLMSNLDLISTSRKIIVKKQCNTTIGEPGVLASRLQPNHTTDDPDGIMLSTLEGLSYGVGDALIGVNPVNDTVESTKAVLERLNWIKNEYKIPTQICVLAHVTTQIAAIKDGAPSDLIFQSIAGSQAGNSAFGIDAALIKEAQQVALNYGTAKGKNVLYFETGQGSEFSSDCHFGIDQLTMEARCYGFAKRYDPFLVNTVVGFIGPEYLYDSKQVIRAGLEDHFMGKLHGLSMGVDACYTNHMKVDQNDLENLATLLTAAGCSYLIGVPAGDDIMLNYQSAGYHDIQTLRETLGAKAIAAFEEWLMSNKLIDSQRHLTPLAGNFAHFLPAYSQDELLALKEKGSARIDISRCGSRYTTSTLLNFRADHASAQDAVLTKVNKEFLTKNKLTSISTRCNSQEEYITRPDLGRRINTEGVTWLAHNCKKKPTVQIYISDGLSSKSIEANTEQILPALIAKLESEGIDCGTPFFLKYGRVAASDEVAEIVGSTVCCVLIGERPGLGSAESMSAYITYKGHIGTNDSGRNVISNIHRTGLAPTDAVVRIASMIKQMIAQKCSGVGFRYKAE